MGFITAHFWSLGEERSVPFETLPHIKPHPGPRLDFLLLDKAPRFQVSSFLVQLFGASPCFTAAFLAAAPALGGEVQGVLLAAHPARMHGSLS